MRTVAIFGCPRSGTSWLGQIFNASPHAAYRYQPLFSYEFKDWFSAPGFTAASVRAFHAAIAGASSDFVLTELRPPKARLTHLVWKEVRHHASMAPLLATGELDALVYLFRPPVDVLNSWFQAPKEFRAGQDIHAEWLNAPSKNTQPGEFNGLEQWKASLSMACALARNEPQRVTLVSYDRLRGAAGPTIARLFDRLGLAPTPEVDAFVAESVSRQGEGAYSVFRNERTALRLPPDIVAAIEADAQARALLASAGALALP